jgi:tRNA uracil 4-sulfurtransferase
MTDHKPEQNDTSPSPTPEGDRRRAQPVLVVRYSEIGLKGGNRRLFEKALAANLKHALKPIDHGPVERPRGRIIVRGPSDPEEAALKAAEVFGVASVSPGLSVAPIPEVISRVAHDLVREALARRVGRDTVTFRVTSRRTDKTFPHSSMEYSSLLGGELLLAFPRLAVDLRTPDLTVGVEVRADEALVFCRRFDGPGGIPIGTMGKVVSLLSGGIDSPVASWLAMKRGARVLFITFNSYPFTSEASQKKTESLVQRLAHFQRGAPLFVVPFTDIQVAIKKACPEQLRTILYRRMMFRLAGRLAGSEGALALVTGESLGQVASQTLENIGVIAEPAGFPVLRPLICFDKTEAITLARRIGTYDISIQPFPDSCTVFQPRKPKIRATLEETERAEEALDVDALLSEAFDGVEKKIFY